MSGDPYHHIRIFTHHQLHIEIKKYNLPYMPTFTKQNLSHGHEMLLYPASFFLFIYLFEGDVKCTELH